MAYADKEHGLHGIWQPNRRPTFIRISNDVHPSGEAHRRLMQAAPEGQAVLQQAWRFTYVHGRLPMR
jgi:hypothetical protein